MGERIQSYSFDNTLNSKQPQLINYSTLHNTTFNTTTNAINNLSNTFNTEFNRTPKKKQQMKGTTNARQSPVKTPLLKRNHNSVVIDKQGSAVVPQPRERRQSFSPVKGKTASLTPNKASHLGNSFIFSNKSSQLRQQIVTQASMDDLDTGGGLSKRTGDQIGRAVHDAEWQDWGRLQWELGDDNVWEINGENTFLDQLPMT